VFPDELDQSNVSKVFKFFGKYGQERDICTFVKIVVVGENGVGKTELVSELTKDRKVKEKKKRKPTKKEKAKAKKQYVKTYTCAYVGKISFSKYIL